MSGPLALLLALALAPAAEPDRRVVVLPVDVTGGAPAGTAGTLHERLQQGLARTRLEIVETHDASAKLRSCDATCLRELATKNASSRLVRTRVEVDDAVWRVAIELVDGRTGEIEAVVEERCEICGVDEVGELIAARVAGLVTRTDAISSAPALLTVQTRPADAKVSVDGVAVAAGTRRLELKPGRHVVRVVRDGYAPQDRLVVAAAAVHESIVVELSPEPEPPRVVRARKHALGWGGAALAAGVVGIAAGIPLLVIHGREYQRDCNVDPLGHCEFRYDTRTGGAVALAVGVALATTGAVLVGISNAKRKRSGRARLQPTGSGLVWRF